MRRLLIILSSLSLPLGFAMLTGVSLGALLATLGIGLLTSLFLVPAVLLFELISRRTGAQTSRDNRAAL